MDKIYFAKLREDAIIPSKREEDGCYDIYASFEGLSWPYFVIKPNSAVMIPTGIKSAFSSNYVGILKERGSTGTKNMGQRAGVIDSGYRAEWFIPISNHNSCPIVIYGDIDPNDIQKIEAFDNIDNVIFYSAKKAICQMLLVEVPKIEVVEVLPEVIDAIASERGLGSLGSSGK